MKVPIYIAASPNTQLDDFLLAVSLILRPWTWFKQSLNSKLENQLTQSLGVKHAHVVDSARSGIYLTLKALGIGEGDEVILPSFTCLVVANAVRWTQATPIYLDSNSSDFNASYKDITSKITKRTKAILVQHTFGKLVDISKLRSQLSNSQAHIYIIEDWAHSVYSQMRIDGDAALLTFGIEKLFSGVRGGAVLTNNEDFSIEIAKLIKNLPKFPIRKAIVSLTNPVFWYLVTPLHALAYKNFSLGAAIRFIWRKLGFLGNMIEQIEHEGAMPKWFPAQSNPALSELARHQLLKLNKLNTHRTNIARVYDEILSSFSDYENFDPNRVYIRYPLLLPDKTARDAIWQEAKKLKITLGDWYEVPLYSKYVNDFTYTHNCYVPSTTPNTLSICERVVNLPTSVNISKERAKLLATSLKKVLERNSANL